MTVLGGELAVGPDDPIEPPALGRGHEGHEVVARSSRAKHVGKDGDRLESQVGARFGAVEVSVETLQRGLDRCRQPRTSHGGQAGLGVRECPVEACAGRSMALMRPRSTCPLW